MTHQEIVDRMEALGVESSAAYREAMARINKERESLQELCGGLGHVWGAPPLWKAGGYRACVVCHAPEKAKA